MLLDIQHIALSINEKQEQIQANLTEKIYALNGTQSSYLEQLRLSC